MKFFVALALTVACAYAAPQSYDESAAEILESTFDIDNDNGVFQYTYRTANDIAAQVQGRVNNKDTDYPALEIVGNSHHTAPDGTPIDLSYVANEFGFQPQGSHLPVPPPTPEAILRALKYIEENAARIEASRRL